MLLKEYIPQVRNLLSVSIVAALVVGCNSESEDRDYIDGNPGGENFVANIIDPPSDLVDRIKPAIPPKVMDVTGHPNEQVPTEINHYHEYPVNQDLMLTRGTLNHTRDSDIMTMDFTSGAGINLIPIERSTGQFSMETTTDSVNHLIDQGHNVIGAINADPYNMVNGWNLGAVTIDGENFTGWGVSQEAVIIVNQDDSLAIWEHTPNFELTWGINDQYQGSVANVYYFDKENYTTHSFSQEGGNLNVYPGDRYRGTVDLTGRTGALVKPQINGVSVVANEDDGSAIAQFAPFEGDIVQVIEDDTNYIVPAGHILVTSPDIDLVNGDRLSTTFQTDDPRWSEVKHALGAGFRNVMLVKDGQLHTDNDESAISGRTAFGIRADGSGFFLVADKPIGTFSDGITLRKLAQIMQAYGAVDAVNLDGGGSTTMTMRMPGEKYNHVINVPSDGSERVVASKWGLRLNPERASYDDAIAIFPKEMTILANSTYRRFKALGYDGDSLHESGEHVEFGINDRSIGLIDVDSGAFRASANAAEGFIIANLGENPQDADHLKGVAKINVVTDIDEMYFGSDQITLGRGESTTILPVLTASGQIVTYEPHALNYTLDNNHSGRIDSDTGIFYAADIQGGEVTVTVSYTNNGQVFESTIDINIGLPPVIIEDFEGSISHLSAIGARDLNVDISQVDTPVFDGEYSLELSWEADPNQPGTFGAYVVDTDKVTELPGYPRQLGVNVYIPEELAGKVWWVRGQLRDGDGNAVGINYNNEGEALPSRGWNFMTADIPEGHELPLTFDQPFRFLVLQTAERIDTSVVLDNFTAIYDVNTDLAGPSVTLTPSDRDTVNSKDVTVRLQVFDESGVDFDRIELELNGEIISSGEIENNGDDAFWVKLHNLDDGWHRLDYRVFDKLGNASAGDSLFNVITDDARIYIGGEHDTIYAGGTFNLPIQATKAETFSTFTLSLNYDATKTSLKVLAEDLEFENVIEENGYWQGTFNGFSENVHTLAQIELTVDGYVQNSAASLVISGELDGKPFYYPVLKKDIAGKYIVVTEHTISHQDARIFITDANGVSAPGVDVERVYYDVANDLVTDVEFIGTTDQFGLVRYPPFDDSDSSIEFTLRAFDSEGASLMSKLMALKERLTAIPRYAFFMPGKDQSEVKVTWFTDSETEQTYARFGQNNNLNQSGVELESEILPFFYGPESGVVRVHHATLTGLQADTEYHYQVGNDDAWSDVFSFTTDRQDEEVRIHLFGDTQTTNDYHENHGSQLVSEIFAKMQAQLPNPDLILHVGDMTEDMSDYQLVRQFFEALEGEGRMSSVMFAPSMGNHEVYNEGRHKYESIFKSPANGPFDAPNKQAVYSFDYGNARIGVITTEFFTIDEWVTMVDWIEEDMAQSEQKWKLLLMHRPPYEGNKDSGNEWPKRYLPRLVDKAGIDLVIAGHDHMYSRSLPMAHGQPNESGATYLIAGSASMKFYDADFGGIVPFADVLYDDNVHTYTTLHIQGESLEVHTRNLSGQLIDRTILTPRASRGF
ncbi:phosphodiester glycosidase family protein [Vibrio sp. 10N.286.49.B1]|uniref:phosphodiester glycosidase family protein n=1 Tax=unclassified Vibrio TaxID=2614977 RepID=UPI0018E3FD09|nr:MULTISPECIES: phosphodiester glycosidase family protein [unclassified Vibrio]